ncbi:hypothetical protein Nmel_013080 [Mimus melanotis]
MNWHIRGFTSMAGSFSRSREVLRARPVCQHRYPAPLLTCPTLALQTAPGVHRRLFRKVHNLISAFQKPNQGIVTPLQNPVVNHVRANYSPGRNEGYDFHLQPS